MWSILRLVAFGSCLLLVACAVGPTRLASTEITAAEILTGNRKGEVAAAATTRGGYDEALARAARAEAISLYDSRRDLTLTEVVTHIRSNDYAQALVRVKEVEESARTSGWFDYNRAIALAGLARTDDAVAAFEEAETRFAADGDERGRAIAIYGRARALDHAYRCREARLAYEDYAAFVRPTAPRDAEMAVAIARACSAD